MVHRLPPLNSLRLFEAAGRRSSFKSAAEELDITASAVSHGIQSLEDWLGVPLFVRSSRALGLTEAGASYLPAVQKALAMLASATDQVPSSRPRSRLAMSVTPTFAARLLLPRLTRFTATRPSLRIDLDTSYRTVEFPRDGFDVAIRLGKGEWPGLSAVPLLNEVLVPVCSPLLLQKLDPPASLCDAPLIHLTRVSEDWDSWARITGLGAIDCRRGLMVDTHPNDDRRSDSRPRRRIGPSTDRGSGIGLWRARDHRVAVGARGSWLLAGRLAGDDEPAGDRRVPSMAATGDGPIPGSAAGRAIECRAVGLELS